MKPYRFLAEAETEIVEIVEWLTATNLNATERFRRELGLALDRIRSMPLMYARFDDTDFRECLLTRFPYIVVYRDHDHEVLIVAVAHAKRERGYWNDRLTEDDI